MTGFLVCVFGRSCNVRQYFDRQLWMIGMFSEVRLGLGKNILGRRAFSHLRHEFKLDTSQVFL